VTSLQFSPVWPWWAIVVVAVLGSVLIGRWYWRESQHLFQPFRWLLPLLRALAFALILLMLLGPSLLHRKYEGEMSRVRVLLDLSESMSIENEGDLGSSQETSKQETRLSRVQRWLQEESSPTLSQTSWLSRIGNDHVVEWYATSQSSSKESTDVNLLWDSNNKTLRPSAVAIEADGINSRLGEGVASLLRDKPAAIVLISDGQNNAGKSLVEAAEQAASAGVQVCAIGIGPPDEPNDFGLLQVEHSQRVFRTDLLRGTMQVKENAPKGTSYCIFAEQFGKSVWSKEFETLGQGIRRIEFEIPAESLVDVAKAQAILGSENVAASTESATVPINLSFSIESNATEVSLNNNQVSTSLWGVNRRNRVLLLDQRGGWETRYIKNALTRDEAWDVTVAIGRTAFESSYFPTTRSLLFDYDLLLMSVETVAVLSEEQQTWIKDFVSASGGGVILIDSKSNITLPQVKDPLMDLFPVRSLPQQTNLKLQAMQIATNAIEQSAMQLGADSQLSQQLWKDLPAPRSIRQCELLPGAEALLEASDAPSNNKQTLIATKLFGQGRVVYLNNDESWRWRYNVADLYHQRFWNQLSAWTMRAPFASKGSFASLDAGLRMISNSETIVIRAKLNADDSQISNDALVQAVVTCDGQPYTIIPMSKEADVRGFYRTSAGPFPVGEYRVQLQATGIPKDAMDVQCQFVVQPPIDMEMQSLSCNTVGLQQLASATGGTFVAFDQAESITEHLKQFQTGKWIESQTLLWQSFPWFATIMLLLALEWILRKRSGLL
jgi:hypothetical protein